MTEGSQQPEESRKTAPAATGKHASQFRWRPAAVIVATTVVSVVIARAAYSDNNANKFLITSACFALGLAALAVWFVLGSGLRARTRWTLAIIGAPLVAGTYWGAGRFIKVVAVSGDIKPILRWSWTQDVDSMPVADVSREETKAIAAALADVRANDDRPAHFPQFLGANRHPVVEGVDLSRDWSEHPPREAWRRPIGLGHSAMAVVDRVAITQEQRGDAQLVVAYDVPTGRVLWSHADEGSFDSFLGGDGPRATPTIDRGRVFTVDGDGRLNCLDAATGQPLWPARDTLADAGADNLEWGKSNSPLLVDDLLVCTGGRGGSSLIAYRQDNGQIAWKAGDDGASYASPVLATIAGRRQILIVNAQSVAGHDPADGRLLWRFAWPSDHPKASQPIALPGDRVWVTAGYGLGCVMLQLASEGDGALSAKELWANRNMKCKFTNVAVLDGHAYGLDDGIMACIDLDTGERTWKRGRFGHGQVLLTGDVLLVLAEDGQLVMLDAVPDAYRELGRIQALEGKTWNNPALAGRYLLLRNSQEAVCYELTMADGSNSGS